MLGTSSLRGLDKRVWVLCGGRVISATGFSIVMPFLAIHLNQDLDLSMSQVGTVFLVMAAAGAFGQILGGELADRLGRRPVMWVSMGLRALVFLALFLVLLSVPDIWLVAGLLVISSVLGSLFEPASNAMVTDMVGPGRRMEAYSLLRVGQNVGWTLGPLISGLLIVFIPFSYLFAVAAITCSAVAIVVLMKVPEPSRSQGPHEKFHPRDLLKIWHNKLFLIFCLATLPLGIVMGQMSSTFSVFCVEQGGITEAGVGYLYALNGVMVVALQFPTARYINQYRMPFVLATGALLYAVGYFVLGLATFSWVLVLSLIITTVGENVVSPSSTNMVAAMSPENERGRYMGAYGIFSSFGWSLGPAMGGVLYDGLSGTPLGLWSAVAGIAMLSVVGFLLLERSSVGSRSRSRGTGAKG